MATLPTGGTIDLSGGVEYVSQPSRTWCIDPATKRITGTCDGYEAVRQAVETILQVERYRWQIFDPASGMEWEGLLGQDAGFVAAELQRRLEDALLADDRITGVENFEYSVHGQSLAASFTVKTIYGSVDSATEVNVTA